MQTSKIYNDISYTYKQMNISTTHPQTDAQIYAQKVQCLFLFLRHSFFAWVHYPAHRQSRVNVCVADDERITLPLRGRTSFHSCPPPSFTPFYSAPAGIFFFSSGEMSDLFHHPEHRGWTLPHIHQTSVKLKKKKSTSFLNLKFM